MFSRRYVLLHPVSPSRVFSLACELWFDVGPNAGPERAFTSVCLFKEVYIFGLSEAWRVVPFHIDLSNGLRKETISIAAMSS
jgi:hypothetical protein